MAKANKTLVTNANAHARACTRSTGWSAGEITFPTTHGSHQPASDDARDVIRRLLVANPAKRLGCLHDKGARGVKEHAWFAGMDWVALLAKRLPAPHAHSHSTQLTPGSMDEDTLGLGAGSACCSSPKTDAPLPACSESNPFDGF